MIKQSTTRRAHGLLTCVVSYQINRGSTELWCYRVGIWLTRNCPFYNCLLCVLIICPPGNCSCCFNSLFIYLFFSFNKISLLLWIYITKRGKCSLDQFRRMSTEEKRKLGAALTQLSPEDLSKALEIVAENNPSFQATAQEVDLDIDAQVPG